jgi:hypothetical protein
MRSYFVSALILMLMSISVGVSHVAAETSEKKWEESIPPLLKPWVPWVLRQIDTTADTCPSRYDQLGSKFCLWFSRLELSLDETSAQAEFFVLVDAERALVKVPGSRAVWPKTVLQGDTQLPVVDGNGYPTVELARGAHQLSIRYAWTRMPSSFPVPPEVALFSMKLHGKQIEFPKREATGDVWTQRAVEEQTVSDNIEIEVYRKLDDGIPQILQTTLLLRVAGKVRELSFDKKAFPGEIFQLDSQLATQLDQEKCTIQIKPGSWTVSVYTKLPALTDSFTPPSIASPWPESEVWAVAVNSELRMVEISSEQGRAISIEQTNAPGEWQQLPLFVLTAETPLTLSEQRRGGTRSARDELKLEKQLWLDFDGKEFSAKDSISGAISQAGRLHFVSPGALGRVTINNVDQYITKLGDSASVGVEVREGNLQLAAESRVTRDTPVSTGWDRDFDQVSGSLMLPPGWKLYSAGGVDWTSSGWIQTWSLLDIFLVLVTAVACYRLFSPVVGVLAGVTLILVEPEQTFSVSILLFVLAAALSVVVPEGTLQRVVRSFAVLAAVGFTVQVIFFAVFHLRLGMYPQLQGFYSAGSGSGGYGSGYSEYESMPVAAPQNAYQDAPMERSAAGVMEELSEYSKDEDSIAYQGKTLSSSFAGAGRKQKQQLSQYVQDANRTTQTGYGVATWSGTTVRFGWNGPVSQGETISFRLLSPWQNLFLAVVRVLLLGLVLGILLKRYFGPTLAARLSNPAGIIPGVALLAALCGLLTFASPAQAETEFPSQQILDDLRNYIVSERDALPKCAPNCASISEVVIRGNARELSLDFTVESLVRTAVALPTIAEGIRIRGITNNATAIERVSGDSSAIWVGVEAGRSRVTLALELSAVDEVSFSFPFVPKLVHVDTADWQADGIRDGVLTTTAVTLRRIASEASAISTSGDAELSGAAATSSVKLAPLAKVFRTVELGVNWTVTTEVERISSASATLQLEVPLLPGEAITSAQVSAKDGVATVVLPPGSTSLQWESTLPQNETLQFVAPVGAGWSEVWRVNATNLWHVEFSGTPRIYTGNSSDTGIPEWQPRPGETLSVAVSRPSGVEGPTTTIDSVTALTQVGKRLQEVSLTYSVRSSKGAFQELALPANSELTSLQVNGTPRPLRLTDGKLKIDLVPGQQTIALKWRESRDLTNSFQTSAVSMGIAAVNTHTTVQFPTDRWVLFLQGPIVGPAVLFWSVVPICFLVAFALSRWEASPLKFYQWALLFLGLSQVSMGINLIIVAWFVLFAIRKNSPLSHERRWRSRFKQLFLAGLTFATVVSFFRAIRHGLLATPQMKIEGISSGPFNYYWFQDRIDGVLPIASVFSLDIFWYRAVMLVWALWLSFAALGWLRWAWDAYSVGGYWPSRRTSEPVGKAVKPVTDESDSAPNA